MKFIPYLLLSCLSLASLTGCMPSLSPATYNTANTGQIQRVAKGVIVSSRIVQVSDDSNGLGVGTVAGGALGALAGSELGAGRGSLAAGIGGALLGGIAGNQAQQALTNQNGVEYVIRLPNKSLISIVQGLRPLFNRGQHILVQYNAGGRSRVIADPEYN